MTCKVCGGAIVLGRYGLVWAHVVNPRQRHHYAKPARVTA